MENSMEVPQKIKNRTTMYDPGIPFLSINLKEMKSLDTNRSDICTPMFTLALFTIAKTWKPLECPSTDECGT